MDTTIRIIKQLKCCLLTLKITHILTLVNWYLINSVLTAWIDTFKLVAKYLLASLKLK